MLKEFDALKYIELLRKCSAALSEPEKFRFFLSRMTHIKYGWGKENFFEADCSGSVCLALRMATGYKVRMTADCLFRKIFTEKNPERNSIQALFFLSETDRAHGNRIAKKGEAVHVAGLAGDDVALNCVNPCAELRTSSDLETEYFFRGCRMVLRGLNLKALREEEKSGIYCFDDPELGPFLEMGLL